MKPLNWRRYYGYRPPIFRRAPATKAELVRLADAYTTWLAESRGWPIADAIAYIDRQRRGAGSAPIKPVDVPLIGEAA
jgi:hypothetical protein